MEDRPSKINDEYLEIQNKSYLYKLRRKIINYLKNLFNKGNYIAQHNENMENHKNEYNQKVINENNNFEMFISKIEDAKNQEIIQIEQNKNKRIEENHKKYNDLISYLESIKNDKEKILLFFNTEKYSKIV